jgi:hypothetical protein
VCSGKVALLDGMLAVGSTVAVAAHSAGSSTVVVTASVHCVLASEAVVVTSGIGGTTFALVYVAGSFAVA